jgi:hypothetical protein
MAGAARICSGARERSCGRKLRYACFHMRKTGCCRSTARWAFIKPGPQFRNTSAYNVLGDVFRWDIRPIDMARSSTLAKLLFG